MFERGFTTLELIVTLIIIGIVSVTVIPRFYKSSDFEQYGYQKELVVKLRAIQLRAMQQAHSDTCKRIFFSTNQIFLRSSEETQILPRAPVKKSVLSRLSKQELGLRTRIQCLAS